MGAVNREDKAMPLTETAVTSHPTNDPQVLHDLSVQQKGLLMLTVSDIL